MCLIAFAWQHPRYRLVLAGNRDEFHGRASAALARWDEAPEILAGRDLQALGTWLGVSERGRLAAVTNVRLPEPPPPGLLSRGKLTSDFLRGDATAQAHADALVPTLPRYGGCNLLLFDREHAVYASNQPSALAQSLAAGVYGLSNAALDTPWPKTTALREALAGWLQAADDRVEPLFEALADEHQPGDDELPDTGVGLERERLVAPAFIRNPEYGTRCSTVVTIGHDGAGRIVERRFGRGGIYLGEIGLDFRFG